jgi:hypothetical protein
MTKQIEFDIKIQAAGIDIHRKVDERIGRRIVSILIGGEETGEGDEAAKVGTDLHGNGKTDRSLLSDTREKFFAALKNEKPSDNALATAAYHYSRYGSAEFTVDEMRDLADDVGVTVPERLDMTYLQAKGKGNHLFRRGSRGAFRPTVHGEAFFKEKYKVRKGNQPKTE